MFVNLEAWIEKEEHAHILLFRSQITRIMIQSLISKLGWSAQWQRHQALTVNVRQQYRSSLHHDSSFDSYINKLLSSCSVSKAQTSTKLSIKILAKHPAFTMEVRRAIVLLAASHFNAKYSEKDNN